MIAFSYFLAKIFASHYIFYYFCTVKLVNKYISTK